MDSYTRNENLRNRIGLIASTIAAALGEGWEARNPNNDGGAWYTANLHGPDNEVLFLHIDKARVVVQGTLRHIYNGSWHGIDNPRITVDPERSPEAIARDIARRVLPGYHDAMKLAGERAAISADYDARKAASMAAVEAVLGKPYRDDNFNLGDLCAGVYGSVRVSADDARIELSSVPIPLVLAILAAIEGYQS